MPEGWPRRATILSADLTVNVSGSLEAINLLTTVSQPLPAGINLAGQAKATFDALPSMINSIQLSSQPGGFSRPGVALVSRNRVQNRSVYGEVVQGVQDGLNYLSEKPCMPTTVLESLHLAPKRANMPRIFPVVWLYQLALSPHFTAHVRLFGDLQKHHSSTRQSNCGVKNISGVTMCRSTFSRGSDVIVSLEE